MKYKVTVAKYRLVVNRYGEKAYEPLQHACCAAFAELLSESVGKLTRTFYRKDGICIAITTRRIS